MTLHFLLPKQLDLVLGPGDRLAAAGLVALMVLAAALEAVGIGALVPFIAVLGNPVLIETHPLLRQAYQLSGVGSVSGFLSMGALMLLVLFVAKNSFLIWMNWTVARFVFAREAVLGARLLRAYLSAPYPFYLKRGPTEMLRVITAEVARAVHGVAFPWFTLVAEVLVLAFVGLMLFVVEPMITLAVLVTVGGLAWTAQGAFRRIVARMRDQRTESGREMFRWVNHGLGAFKGLRVLGRGEHFVEGYLQNANRYGVATGAFTSLNLAPRLAIETLAVAAVLLVVALTLLSGKPLHRVLPVIVLFALAAIRIMPSIGKILSALNNMRFHSAAFELIRNDLEALALAPRVEQGSRTVPLRFERELRISGVFYRHPGMERWILEDVSWTLRKGESVALVGASGAGKSTLTDLLLGLIDASSGEVRVDGEPLRAVRRAWQDRIGFVPQDVFLLDDTIRRNVALGMTDAEIDDARVWRALELAHLDARVRALPEGLAAFAGDRGASLSGGERQRIGIARALYHDPDILVFDEATSALDLRTEREIADTMAELMASKTVLVVAHRPSTVKLCRTVLFLETGRIRGYGTFDELLARDAAFRALFEGERAAA